MSMAATAIKTSMEDIDSILRLLVRDDIVSWYTSKSMAKSDIKTQELENQLGDRVAKNVAVVQSKNLRMLRPDRIKRNVKVEDPTSQPKGQSLAG
jgi:phosphatidylinositol kinase/protein kinase (PI-3  family)